MASLRLLVIAPAGASWLSPLSSLPPGIDVRVGDSNEFLDAEAPGADVILNSDGSGVRLRRIWPVAQGVRWVHSLAAGVENQLFPEMLASAVPLTNSRGVYRESLGEFILAAVLYFAKDLARMRRNQSARRWEQFDVEIITGRTMGIVGYGEIGQAVARRAKALGMHVVACRRRTEPDGIADETVPEVKQMIGRCQYIVVTAPLTANTRGLIGEAEFAAMRPDAVLMNIGRGPVVDEQALIGALRDGRIRGAALDVFDKEPLPEDHPLWGFDNVLLSPHCADHIDGWQESAVEFFVANCGRFLRGEPLLNLVNKEAGY